MTYAPGERLRCPRCGKLLVIAFLPPGGWVESACGKCRHLVIFEPSRDPVVMARHGQPEAAAEIRVEL